MQLKTASYAAPVRSEFVPELCGDLPGFEIYGMPRSPGLGWQSLRDERQRPSDVAFQ